MGLRGKANILVLEDSQKRHRGFVDHYGHHNLYITTCTKRCIEKLTEKRWDVIFLDHDLGGEVMVESGPGTGYEVAVWLKENPEFKPGEIIIHSMNPVGVENIRSQLPEAKYVMAAWNKNILRKGRQ